MDAEIKKKWVEALRSGRYKQGYGRLHGDNNYCCLGVLCDVIDNTKWYKGNYSSEFVYVYKNVSCLGHVPLSLRKEIGMSLDQHNKLCRMNDNGDSFETIANHIEENL